MKGTKTKPENEKVRKYRMSHLHEKIDALRTEYLSWKNRNTELEGVIKKHQAEIKDNEHTIEKLRRRKDKYMNDLEELAQMKLEVEDIEELKREKSKLEVEVERLKRDLNEADKAFKEIEEKLDFEDEDE